MEQTDDPNPTLISYIPSVVIMCIPLGLMLWNSAALSWHELAWIVLYAASGFIRMPFSQRNKANEITVDKKTLQESILLMAMFLSMGILPVLYLASKATAFDLLAFANYSLPFGLTGLGACLVPAFAYLFWRSHYDLGRNWSVSLEMRQEHNLVTNGVYKRMRHPMYAAIWIAAIAQPLLIHNVIAGGLVLVAFGAMCVLRIPKEEEMMLGMFGDDYREYMARTGRVLPKFS